jgi:hypothetical protein
MENVAINETLVDSALRVSINQSAGDVVEEALRFFIAQKQQAQIRELRGKLHWEGDIDAMRRDKLIPWSSI